MRLPNELGVVFGHGGSFLLSWLRLATSSSAKIRGGQALHNSAKDSVPLQLSRSPSPARASPDSDHDAHNGRPCLRLPTGLLCAVKPELPSELPDYPKLHRIDATSCLLHSTKGDLGRRTLDCHPLGQGTFPFVRTAPPSVK